MLLLPIARFLFSTSLLLLTFGFLPLILLLAFSTSLLLPLVQLALRFLIKFDLLLDRCHSPDTNQNTKSHRPTDGGGLNQN